MYLTNRRHLQRRSSVNAMTLWNKLLRKISQWPIQLIHHMNCRLQYHDSDLVFQWDKTSQICHQLFAKLIYDIEKPFMLISMSLLSCWWLCCHLLPCTFLALLIHSFHTISRKKLWKWLLKMKWFVSNQRYIILTLWPCKIQSIHIPQCYVAINNKIIKEVSKYFRLAHFQYKKSNTKIILPEYHNNFRLVRLPQW